MRERKRSTSAPAKPRGGGRVLLFVQTGDGRPKQIAVAHGEDRSDQRHAMRVELDGFFVSWVAAKVATKVSDRWWLVEAESAEAARTLIYLSDTVEAARRFVGAPADAPVVVNANVDGRILASGGREGR